MPLLDVKDLKTCFRTSGAPRTVVDGISFSVDAGEVLGLVGESGCGKSLTALSLLREVLGREAAETTARDLFPGVPEESRRLLLDALDKGINVVPTSSAGRLFDAASAIAGLCALALHPALYPNDATDTGDPTC